MTLLAFLFALPAQARPIPNWLNVMDFGAKGDGRTDDSAAILAAVRAAQGRWGGNVVYFPPSSGYGSGGYMINSPLNLPSTTNRTTLFFDSQIQLNAPLSIGDNYTIRGNTPGGKVAFATYDSSPVYVGYGLTRPAIHIQGTGIRLENLAIGYVHGSQDGILIEKSSVITLKNVTVAMDQNNTVGIPLHIIGGFGYYIEGGGYSSAWNSTKGSVVWDGDPRLNQSGIFRMRDLVFSGHGVVVNVLGGSGSMSFENILMEGAKTAFLIVNSPGGTGLQGVDLKGVNMSDSIAPLSIVDVHGIRVGHVTIINCWTDYGAPATSGDKIDFLNVF